MTSKKRMTRMPRAPRPTPSQNSRRDLLKASACGLAAGIVPRGVRAAAGGPIRIGIVGCGGRGTGAAMQAVAADGRVRIAAIGDLFVDAVDETAAILAARIGSAFDGPRPRRFVGEDAFEGVLAEPLDVVILASPPAFRPRHVARAIERGVHVYAERPLAIDPDGLAEVERAGRHAASRGLSFVTSLPLRHAPAIREGIATIRDGRIGRPISAHIVQPMPAAWRRARQPGWTSEEHRLRNWISIDALSGGLLLDRFMDGIDVAVAAFGGGRAVSAVSVEIDGEGRRGRARAASSPRLRLDVVGGGVIHLELAASGITRPTVAVVGTGGSIDLVPPPFGEAVAAGFDHAWRTLLESLDGGLAVNDSAESCRSNAAVIACREAILATGAAGSFSKIARSKQAAWS